MIAPSILDVNNREKMVFYKLRLIPDVPTFRLSLIVKLFQALKTHRKAKVTCSNVFILNVLTQLFCLPLLLVLNIPSLDNKVFGRLIQPRYEQMSNHRLPIIISTS